MKNLSMVQIIIRSSGFLLRIFLTEDIRLMKLAHINTVTLGVFAWARWSLRRVSGTLAGWIK